MIGQSRGGGLAKVLARRRPDLVCGIVTLGSPQLDPLAVHPLVRLQVEAVGRLGSLGRARPVQALLPRRRVLRGLLGAASRRRWPTASASSSVYSRSDGVVDWRACLDPSADEHVEIAASHCGMSVSPAAWRAVASALGDFSRSEGERTPRRSAPVTRLRRAA